MAFPTVAATNNSTTDLDTNHIVALPSGIGSGNLLLVFFSVNPTTITFPAGWTKFFEVADASNLVKLCIAWRKADGTEGASITVTTSDIRRSVHISYRITGHKDPTVQPPEASSGASNKSTTPNPDALTPTGGAKDYLWIAAEGHRVAADVSAYPTNYSSGEFYSIGGDVTGAVARRELNATSENPGTFTIASSWYWVACVVAVHPLSVNWTKNISTDVLQIRDSLLKTARLTRTMNELLQLYDVFAIKSIRPRQLTDALQIRDSLLKTATYPRQLNEALQIHALMAKTVLLQRSTIDALRFYDALSKTSTYSKQLIDALQIYDTLTKQKTVASYIQEVDFWQIPTVGGEMIVESPTAADFNVTTTELEEGTLVQFTIATTTDLVVPAAGEYVKVLSAFYYCRDDIITELRWKTSDQAVLALPTLGAIGCSRFKLQVGGDTETLELYMSGAGTVKGWVIYQIV